MVLPDRPAALTLPGSFVDSAPPGSMQLDDLWPSVDGIDDVTPEDARCRLAAVLAARGTVAGGRERRGGRGGNAAARTTRTMKVIPSAGKGGRYKGGWGLRNARSQCVNRQEMEGRDDLASRTEMEAALNRTLPCRIPGAIRSILFLTSCLRGLSQVRPAVNMVTFLLPGSASPFALFRTWRWWTLTCAFEGWMDGWPSQMSPCTCPVWQWLAGCPNLSLPLDGLWLLQQHETPLNWLCCGRGAWRLVNRAS